MKNLILIPLLLILFYTANAQMSTSGNGSVKGTVMDAITKQPIEYANVVIYSVKDSSMITGVVTDAAGKFFIKKIPAGSYYLAIQFIGYTVKYITGITIDEKNHDKDFGIIGLETTTKNLNEVEVTAIKNNVEYKIDKKVVDLSKAPADAGATASEALRNVPGVNVDLDGNVTLRGSSNYIVLIDGKPSAMSGNDLLKQIPASTIEKIELVTNPSAKYEAEGTAGIINIILKKGTQGFNGIVNLTAGTGDKYSGDFLFNFKRKKINFFFGGYGRDARNKQYYSWDSRTILNNDTNIVNFDLIKKDHNTGYNFRTGFEYTFNKKNNLSVSGEAGDFVWGSRITFPQYTKISSENIDRYTRNSSVLSNPWTYYYVDLNYQHKFDTLGQELLFSSYYSDGGGISSYDNQEQLSNGQGELFNVFYDKSRVFQDNTDKEIQMKADYTLPIDTTQKIEAGLLSKFRPKTNSLTSETYNFSTNTWDNNESFSNRFDFYHNVYSAYLTYTKSWKKFDFQAGLRSEYADRLLDLKTSDKQYAYKKLDFFPSASVVRKIGKMGQLQLNYSRRINRPDEGSLNPFPDFSTNSILIVGNPELKPEYINSYQLNYMLGPLAVETYYRDVNDAIEGEAFASDSAGRLYLKPVNLDRKIYYGIDISGGAPISKWCQIQAKLSCYNYKMYGKNISTEIPGTSTAFEGFLGARFLITKTAKIEGYGGYSSPSFNSQGKVDKYYYAGASVSQSFFKQQLTAKISINNPFNIFKIESTTKNEYTTSIVRSTREPNVIRFSLSYKINNYKAADNNTDKPSNTGGGGKF